MTLVSMFILLDFRTTQDVKRRFDADFHKFVNQLTNVCTPSGVKYFYSGMLHDHLPKAKACLPSFDLTFVL